MRRIEGRIGLKTWKKKCRRWKRDRKIGRKKGKREEEEEGGGGEERGRKREEEEEEGGGKEEGRKEGGGGAGKSKNHSQRFGKNVKMKNENLSNITHKSSK